MRYGPDHLDALSTSRVTNGLSCLVRDREVENSISRRPFALLAASLLGRLCQMRHARPPESSKLVSFLLASCGIDRRNASCWSVSSLSSPGHRRPFRHAQGQLLPCQLGFSSYVRTTRMPIP